jgi:hypothetical protein
MKILIAGGSGLIGRACANALICEGHSLRILSRSCQAEKTDSGGLEYFKWDGKTTDGWGEVVNDTDVIINLAGESLTHWPWSRQNKDLFWESRVAAGKALCAGIREAERKPKVLLQISGINYYGGVGDPALETTPPGEDFLSRLSIAWEDSTAEVERYGIRRCVVRLAVVLTTEGGLFPLMALPIRLFAGGPQGNGRQIVPWIHMDDVVNGIHFLMLDGEASGPYNFTAPEITDNAQFNRTLARNLHRPYWFRTPSFVIRVILGGMSTLILEGRGAVPDRLMKAGYQFRHATLQSALQDLLPEKRRDL